MKTIFNKSVIAIVLTAGLLTSCINDDDYSVPNLDCAETVYTKTMEPSDITASTVVKLYDGAPNSVIEAYVVSSDVAGNFFKTISLQTLDGSFGFSIPADVTTVFEAFEPGRKVLIELSNSNKDSVYVDIKHSSLRIGELFNVNTPKPEVGRLSVQKFKKIVHRSCIKVSEEDLVQKVTIAEAMTDARINTLIELQNVQFNSIAVGKTYYDENNQIGGATNHYLVDNTGNGIIFRTSSFANYSSKIVPDGSGTVRGVLTKFNSEYQFIIRSEDDIKLTNPRVGE